jgi:hypothetical protein
MRIVGLAKERLQKKLCDLAVAEISACQKAANPHARILLRKSEEAEMPVISTPATAAMGFDMYCTVLAKRDGITKSAAITKALAEPTGRALYEMGRSASAHDVLITKMGGAQMPVPSPGRPHHGGSHGYNPPPPPSASRADTLAYAGSKQTADAAGDGENERRSRAYLSRVEELVRGGMTPSNAHDKARAEMPDDWAAHKSVKPGSLLSSFEQQPVMRGPYQSQYGGGSPYKMPTGNVSNSNVTR